MTFLEEYVANVAALPSELKTNYNMLRELDSRYQDLQKQMLECHGHGLEDVRKVVNSGCAMPDDLVQMYSSEILAIHNECLAVSNDKVTLAVQTYDLVDSHIQSLDNYLQKFKEEAGQGSGKDLEGETSLDNGRSETGRASKDGEIIKSSRRRGQAAAAAAALSASVDLDLPVDPNEPTYCYCKQVSFGEMIACDNAECQIEWFHYDCVGIKEQPKGKWYCPDCSSLVRRRRGK